MGDSYRVRRLRAKGGMSDIFDASHRESGRRVAIKVLPQDKIRHSEYLARLEREGSLLRLAAGSGSVALLDSGECQTYGPYLVMEYLVGRPLDGILISEGPMLLDDALPIFVEVAGCLARLHELRIVHRDIKPANVFITAPTEGAQRAVLLDFGVSTRLAAPDEAHDDPDFDYFAPSVDRLTSRGELLGTIEYMSPEQIMAMHDEVGFESDIFSLGVMMFELLSGDLPYGVDWAHRLQNLHDSVAPRRIDQAVPGVPHELAELVAEMIANRRGDRPSSMRSVHDRLTRIATGLAREPRRPLLEAWFAAKGSNDRKYNRVSYAAPVRMMVNGRGFDGRSEDISERGMLLITRFRLMPGERLSVRFALPLDGWVTQIDAMVRWCREGRERVAVGLLWVDPPAEVTLALRSYVDLIHDPELPAGATQLDAENASR
ncbi:MAG: serine/threonine-protein kinase [Polyangiales bacterium]